MAGVGPWGGDGGDGDYSPSLAEGGEGVPLAGVTDDGVATTYNLRSDEEFWDLRPVKPGCILEIPVSREMAEGPEESHWAVFVMGVRYEATGCWVRARLLGASTDWARTLGIRLISRERQSIHLCLGGREVCQEIGKKGQHITALGVFPPGEGCPGYVDKGKKREWKKLYQEAMGISPGGARGAGGGPKEPAKGEERGPADRISALRKRLQDKKGAREGGAARSARPLSPPRVAFSPEPRAVQDIPNRRRTGEKEDAEEKEEKEKTRKRRTRSVGQALAEVAVALGQKTKHRSRRDSGSRSSSSERSRSRGRRSRRRRKKRSRSKRDSRSSSGGRTSSSSSLVPPLQRKANREPGSVLRMLLQNVAVALAEAAVGGEAERSYLGGRGNQLSSYFQIVARPQMTGKIRDLRELETIARCLDYLKEGKLAEVGDALAGRFMAVEAAALTNSWQDAQHLEVIPAHHGGVTSPAVLLQAQRHAKQVEKATSRGPWKRPTYGGEHTTPARAEGWNPRPKGKGDNKGKGRGAKGGKGGAAWKDKEKEKADGGAGAK